MNLRNFIELSAGKKLAGRTEWHGLKISLENLAGDVRHGKDKDGKPWTRNMKNDYGYILGTEGADGDHLDCYVGTAKTDTVYIVHQNNPETGKYDEDKCFLGFKSAAHAKKKYLAHMNNAKFFGSITEMNVDDFKEKIKHRDFKGKRLSAMVQQTDSPMGVWIDPIPSFHAPSEINPERVPVDEPGETDDEFLDVTNRKAATEFRMDLFETKPRPVPITRTNTQHHIGSPNT